ncbi:MAG: DUF3592 domain-containing protein [Candidatus Sericytochromatia bacterium]
MHKTLQGILAFFLVSIFGLVAIGMLGFLGRSVYLHFQAAQWKSVPAEILKWDLVQGSGKKSNAKLVAQYRYTFQNRRYTGQELDFSVGSDNFSSGRRRRQMDLLRQNPAQVFVNPANPAESVLDRSLPVQQVAFALFFLIFPCGLGTVFILSYLLQFIQHVSGLQAQRFVFPLLGLLHSLPAPYALLVESPDRGWGSGLILFLFSLLLVYSLFEFAWRIRDSQRGLEPLQLHFPRKKVPASPEPIKRTL